MIIENPKSETDAPRMFVILRGATAATPNACNAFLRRKRVATKGVFQSGQMGQTVNLLLFSFGGSNPSAPTATKVAQAEVFSKASECLHLQLDKAKTPAKIPSNGIFAEIAQSIEH